MNIFITGIAGFIGSTTAEKLKRLGHHVAGIDNFSPYYDVNIKRATAALLTGKDIAVLEGDVRSFSFQKYFQVHNPDIIIHFAAQPGIANTTVFEDYLSNNVLGTKNILDAIEEQTKKPYFINIATSSIYGAEATLSEDSAPKPTSFYGVTKLAAEQLVMAANRQAKLKACSLRLYSVYGPRERPDKLYPRLIAAALKSKPFSLYEGSLTHLRSFTYVDDIVSGIVAVIGKLEACNGEIINLGSETEYTTQEGITLVEKLLDVKINMEVHPKRTGDQLRTKANITKAKKILGYKPDTNLEEGLKQNIIWAKANRGLLP